MFDYSIHKIYCPICKRTREEWAKGSGANYYIKGHGRNIYYKDTCSLCGKSYYLIAGHNGIIEMRVKGISLQEAIERMKEIVIDEKDSWFLLSRISFNPRNFTNLNRNEYCQLSQREIEIIEKQCKEIYGLVEQDLFIPAELVSKNDLEVESVWMS